MAEEYLSALPGTHSMVLELTEIWLRSKLYQHPRTCRMVPLRERKKRLYVCILYRWSDHTHGVLDLSCSQMAFVRTAQRAQP